MAKVTVTDAEVRKLLKRYKDPSVNELKRVAQRLGITRPKGQGKGGKVKQNLARQIAEHEKRHRMKLFQVKRTPAQQKILEEQRRLRNLKLQKFGKGFKTTSKIAGKTALPLKVIYEGGVGLAQFDPAQREKSVEKFRDAGWTPFGLDTAVTRSEVGKPIMTVGKGLWNPAQSISGYYSAGGVATRDAQELIERSGEKRLSPAQIKADTNRDGRVSEEERAAALEKQTPMLGTAGVAAMRAGRRAAADKKYFEGVPSELLPSGDDKWFYGGAGDTEFIDEEKESILSHFRTKQGVDELLPKMKEMLREQHEGTRAAFSAEEELGEKLPAYKRDPETEQIEFVGERGYRTPSKEYFDADDRAAFRKAALDGTLLEMFDVDKSGTLSNKEKKLFFDREQGFKAGGPKAAADLIPAPDLPTEPAAIEGDLPVHAAGSDFDRPEYDGTVGELEEPTEAPEPPPTTREYADMMRQAIDNEAIGIEERNEVMRTIRDEMVAQDLTTPEQFNRIGRQMLEESDARKAAAHVAYLRSPAGSDWVDTPGLDRLAALQKAPFGRGTALEGSVGKLTDESRQLESIGGRQRRLARELEGKGYRSVAGQVRAGAPRRPLMSQRDRIELQKKKKALAAEQAAAQALISKGEENINANTVS